MATIIDALIVTLGLDTSDFKKGTQDTSGALKKVSDDTNKCAKEIESRGKQITQAFRAIRTEVLALYATYKAAVGIDNFVRDVTNSDAALGRLAHNLDIGTQTLAAWEGAAERAGGSASATGASMQGLVGQLQQFAMTGQSAVIPYFRALGVHLADANGKMRPMSAILLDLADKFQGMDPARASAIGAGLGLDQGTINLLEQGRAAVQALLDQQAKLGVTTEADAKRAQALRNAFLDFQQTLLSVGRTILNVLSPSITELLKQFEAWFTSAAGTRFIQELVDDIREFVVWLGTVDWKKQFAGFEDIGGEILDIFRGIEDAIRTILDFVDRVDRFLGGKGIAFMHEAPGSSGAGHSTWRKDGKLSLPGMPDNPATPYTIDPANPDAGRNQWEKDHPPGLFDDLDGWWRQNMPTWLGGKPAPTAASGGKQLSDATPEGQALLDQIAVGESGGRYNVRYSPTGDKTFVPGVDHPRIYEPTPDGSNVSSAAGKYQFTATTWDELQNLLVERGYGRLPDFSPASQEKAGWFWVQEIYRRQFPGHDLTADLKAAKHDPALLASIANAMHAEWTSAPGGSEPNRATAGFIPGLEARLDKIPDASQTLLALLAGVKQAADSRAKLDHAMSGSARHLASRGVVHHSSTNETHVGTINIHTKATDAKGIATDIGDAMAKYAFVHQANTGLA